MQGKRAEDGGKPKTVSRSFYAAPPPPSPIPIIIMASSIDD
jgi:hypothetical protein